MSKEIFKVSLSPIEALEKIKQKEDAELVHSELHEIDANKSMGILVYEKYYFRAKNRAALVIIIDNLRGFTEVRSVATASSEGMLLNLDWGAADHFAFTAKRILENYIVD